MLIVILKLQNISLWDIKEDVMLEVTEAATKQIADYFKDKEVQPVRIFLNQGGWGGPSLAMALDEQRDNDEVYDIDGFQYVVEKEFMEKAKPIKVDFLPMGFKVTSSIELPQDSACGSCGSDGSASCG